eukprot:1045664-Lingulodinium_polyedra.AAC.1
MRECNAQLHPGVLQRDMALAPAARWTTTLSGPTYGWSRRHTWPRLTSSGRQYCVARARKTRGTKWP